MGEILGLGSRVSGTDAADAYMSSFLSAHAQQWHIRAA